MTPRDIQTQINAVFARSPLVPAVLDLGENGRVIVDMPEQLEARPDAVIIRRRTDPTVHRIGYETIDRVVPLDELPGEEGGLSYAAFYAAVRPLLWQEPYQPFAVEFRDGTRLVS